MATKHTFTTGDVARVTGIPQQTLIAWDRSGTLKAARSKRGRASAHGRRHYDENGLAAALLARWVSRMGFRGHDLRRMIALMQRGERGPLEAAAIFTYRNGPGLMTHIFSSEIQSADDQRHLDFLRKQGALIDGPTTLWTIREYLLPIARNMIRMGDKALIEGVMMEDLPK
jgi:DNA-binding transcriptional MerR regulator